MKRPGDRCAFFFFNDTATTEIYTLSLHDALPIYVGVVHQDRGLQRVSRALLAHVTMGELLQDRLHERDQLLKDRKSTRLNSSHLVISYAVFCLKKKKPTCISAAVCSARRNGI